jgi:hypothetical protein
VKRREQTPPICLWRGGSPAARGRDNICRRRTATGVRLSCGLSGPGRAYCAMLPTVLHRASSCNGMQENMRKWRAGGVEVRYATCFFAWGGWRRSTGLAPVRSRRPTLEGCARNWSNGGYMRLKGREAVATVEAMRRIAEAAAVPPRGGYGGFCGRDVRGGLWGSRGRQGPGCGVSCYNGNAACCLMKNVPLP